MLAVVVLLVFPRLLHHPADRAPLSPSLVPTKPPQLLERLAGYRNIPPHHPAATTPEEAYVLPEVFPGVWGSVNSGQLLGASEDAAAAQQLKERHQVRPLLDGLSHCSCVCTLWSGLGP